MVKIRSLLDNDLYKITMMQVAFNFFKDNKVEYQLFFRNELEFPPLTIWEVNEINDSLNYLSSLSFSEEEVDYISTIISLDSEFKKALLNFKFNMNKDIVRGLNKSFLTGKVDLRIYGDWWRVIMLEVPILAIISEVVNRRNNKHINIPSEVQKNINVFLKYSDSDWTFNELGTRRRHSFEYQEEFIIQAKKQLENKLIGTSNMYLARKYKLNCVGTMAHEFISFMLSLTNCDIRKAQTLALHYWDEQYGGTSMESTALTDTFTTPVFLEIFKGVYSSHFDGVRHDSGDPYAWTEQILSHYKNECKIDSKFKTLNYSDGLNPQKVDGIYSKYKDKANLSFGIGTFCSTPLSNLKPSLVIKMVVANGYYVVTLSDIPEKNTCINQSTLDIIQDQL